MEAQTYSFMVVCSSASKHGYSIGANTRLAYTFKRVAIDRCMCAGKGRNMQPLCYLNECTLDVESYVVISYFN